MAVGTFSWKSCVVSHFRAKGSKFSSSATQALAFKPHVFPNPKPYTRNPKPAPRRVFMIPGPPTCEWTLHHRVSSGRTFSGGAASCRPEELFQLDPMRVPSHPGRPVSPAAMRDACLHPSECGLFPPEIRSLLNPEPYTLDL